MNINYNSKSKPRNIIYMLVALGVIILTISWCRKERRQIIESSQNVKGDTLQLPTSPSPQPSYNMALASLGNSKSFSPDFQIVFLPNGSFSLRPKKGSKIEGKYEVGSLGDIIIFNRDGFKDTFIVKYFSGESGLIEGLYSKKLNRSFAPQKNFCQLDQSNALQQIYLTKWKCNKDNQGRGFITLKNYGNITLDSLAICINGDFYDGDSPFIKKFEKHEYRWPKREWSWAKVNLDPDRSLIINLSEAINPEGQRFDISLFEITKVYCIVKVTCEGKTLTTRPILLTPVDN